jgi:hypothetical protein
MEVDMSRFGTALAMVFAVVLQAQPASDFSGTWVFNPARSRNIGMMAELQDTVTIEQTSSQITISDRSTLRGQASTREVRLDLGGKATSNAGPMGDRNETTARWDGGKLVVTWTADGAVAGTKVVRTETRSLSPDGKTMTVESVRGGNAPLVMVFEKK